MTTGTVEYVIILSISSQVVSASTPALSFCSPADSSALQLTAS